MGSKSIVAGLCLPFLISIPALALGSDGHEAVCYIAYDQASPETRQKIDRLLSGDPTYSQYSDPAEAFARSCTWADKVRPGDGRSKEHYVNVPRTTKKITSLDCPEANRCLLSAIVSDLAILRDTEASGEDKLKALKYMGHWIGDLHQPLHVSFKSDRGGNDISVGGVPGCDNLHAVWDTCLVQYFMTSRDLTTSRDLAEYLIADPDKGSQGEFEEGASVLKWANETYKITIEPIRYCMWKAGECLNPGEVLGKHLEKDPSVPDLVLTELAMRSESEILAELMQGGGLRLASLLDAELALAND